MHGRASLSTFYVDAVRRVFLSPARGGFFLAGAAASGLGHAGLAAAAAACAQALAGVRPGWIGGMALPTSPGRLAVTLAAAGLGAAVLKAAGGVVTAREQARMAGEVGCQLRLGLLDGWIAMHGVAHPRHPDHGPSTILADPVSARARGVAALTQDAREVEGGFSAALSAVRAVMQIVPLALLAAAAGWRMLVFAAVVMVPFGVLLGRVRRRVARAHAASLARGRSLLEAADETVRHADLWATYGAERRVRGRVAALGQSLTRQSMRAAAGGAALSGGNEVLGAVGLLAVVLAAGAGWLGPGGAGDHLLPFAVAFFMAYRPVRDLGDARVGLARAEAAFEGLAPVVEVGVRVEAAEEEAAGWPAATLELRALRLAHGALGPLDLRVEPGSVVALVGPTGAGKTTLLRTLLGLEAPRGGEVRYGATPLDAGVGPAARPFAWVPQDAPVVAGTLTENVALAEGVGDAARTEAALDALGAGELAARVGNARLGGVERAVSGGERQWIALARALATRRPVLLLDEPTSGLDAGAQAEVLEAIARLRGRRTVILVTHRLEPLAVADRVIRLAGAEAPVVAVAPDERSLAC